MNQNIALGLIFRYSVDEKINHDQVRLFLLIKSGALNKVYTSAIESITERIVPHFGRREKPLKINPDLFRQILGIIVRNQEIV